MVRPIRFATRPQDLQVYDKLDGANFPFNMGSGASEGGVPIGAVLVLDGEVIGRGHNRRVQQGNPILHGETDCLQNAGRRTAADYRRSTMYTTLSPCPMCSGAILLYGIPKVVIGEHLSYRGEERLLRRRGVSVDVLNDAECVALMRDFIKKHVQLWGEDIGE